MVPAGTDHIFVKCTAGSLKRGSMLESVWARVCCPTHRTETETRSDVTTAVAPGPALTTADRCDRCGAQAYLRVEMPSGAELFFCAHHGREHNDALRAVATTIQDETERLQDAPATDTES
ncbi:hypothetical protein BH20ACT6_BH20ACT6_18610 [soil metagenome]